MISKRHRNRLAHNWLIYSISDRFLQQYSGSFKGTLYDLGAGESTYREFFLEYAEEYVAIDWAESLHSIAADIVADLNELLPIDSESADTVVSLSVLEHLREPQTMLNEAFRILRPGGTMVLQVPWQWWIHEAPHDYFRFTPFALRHMFTKAGFTGISVEPQAGYFTTVVLKFNYFTRRFVRGPMVTRGVVKALLMPAWYLGQLIAPILDRLDTDWAAETTGYFVKATKPAQGEHT